MSASSVTSPSVPARGAVAARPQDFTIRERSFRLSVASTREQLRSLLAK